MNDNFKLHYSPDTKRGFSIGLRLSISKDGEFWKWEVENTDEYVIRTTQLRFNTFMEAVIDGNSVIIDTAEKTVAEL